MKAQSGPGSANFAGKKTFGVPNFWGSALQARREAGGGWLGCGMTSYSSSGLFTTLTFKVSCETQFGDSVVVTGNAPTLGEFSCPFSSPTRGIPPSGRSFCALALGRGRRKDVHRDADEEEVMIRCVSRTREWDGLMHRTSLA